MVKRICILAVMVVLISFLGFVLENAWLAATKGFIDNRNMSFPFLLGYGLLVVGYYEIAGIPDNFELSLFPELLGSKRAKKAAYFLMTFLVVSVGEIVLGLFTERFFGFEYWNYERLPLHITKYTSVPTSCGFALIITIFMDSCFMPIMSAVEGAPIIMLKPFAIVMLTLLASDFFKSFYIMHIRRQPNQRWIIYTDRSKNIKTREASAVR